MFDPRLSERLKNLYGLARPPKDLVEFVDLSLALAEATPEVRKFMKLVRSGEAVVGETEAERGQSIVLPEGREVKVMCSYDALATALLLGQGLVRASCPNCGEKMEARIEGGRVASSSKPSIVYWLGDGPKGIPICDHMNLFPDLEHLASWLETNPEEMGIPLPLDAAVELLKNQTKGL